jgi:hypothetical protein
MRAHIVGLAASSLVLLGLAGCSSATQVSTVRSSGQAQAGSAPASGPSADDSTEVAAAQAIAPVGLADDPQYNDVSVEAAAQTVTVWRVGDGPGPTLDDRYRSLVPAGVTLRYARAPLTAKQVATLDALVAKEMGDFHAAGLNVTVWGQSQGPGKPYVVNYEGARAPAAAIVEKFQEFGPATVMFTPGGVVPLGG